MLESLPASYHPSSPAADMATALATVASMQNSGSGNRRDIPDFVLVITAANPLNLGLAASAAKDLRTTGATIFALGLGYDADWVDLRQLASPGPQNALLLPNPLPLDQFEEASRAVLTSLFCALNSNLPEPTVPSNVSPRPMVPTTAEPRPVMPSWMDPINADVNRIIDFLTNGPGSGSALDWLATLVDRFGPRVVTSPALNDTISFLLKDLQQQGKVGDLRGKIVVYNQEWTGYGSTVLYRYVGGVQAAKYGAVAALIRSVTPFSVNSPHTGTGGAGSPIPVACLTIEDAQLLWRFQTRSIPITITLSMSNSYTGPNVVAQDTVFDITGSTLPNEIILLSGHLDSWDVGEGAMDDGGGVAAAWGALWAMKSLGLRPKRTIRAILWGSEERGPKGNYYHDVHKSWKNETFRFVAESDEGAWRPADRSTALLSFWGNDTYWKGIKTQSLLTLVGDVAEKKGLRFGIVPDKGPDGGDVAPWEKDGVPGVAYQNTDRYEYYFTFHHTDGDTISVLTPEDLDYTSAMWASVAWTLANAV